MHRASPRRCLRTAGGASNFRLSSNSTFSGLQAVFSGCDALVPCQRPRPASDYPEGERAGVPACGYDVSGCENATGRQLADAKTI